MSQSRQELMNKAFELAKKNEFDNGNCAQSVLAGVCDALGINNDDVFRAATGFADGVGLSGDGHCGALSGGVMAISYIFGRQRPDFSRRGKQLKALMLSRQLQSNFKEKYGTCRCHDLQTKFFGRFFNLLEPADMEAASKAGVLETCSNLVGEIASMSVGIILEQQEKDSAKT